MPTLLHIDSSPLNSSVSRELSKEFVKTWTATHASGTVIERDLRNTTLKPVDQTWIYSAHTPEEKRSDEQKLELALSDELISELTTADEYVIGVAMHNFSIPSVLSFGLTRLRAPVRHFRTESMGRLDCWRERRRHS